MPTQKPELRYDSRDGWYLNYPNGGIEYVDSDTAEDMRENPSSYGIVYRGR